MSLQAMHSTHFATYNTVPIPAITAVSFTKLTSVPRYHRGYYRRPHPNMQLSILCTTIVTSTFLTCLSSWHCKMPSRRLYDGAAAVL